MLLNRDSVDSLNCKLDEATLANASVVSNASQNVNQFRINPTDINKEFAHFDLEFNFNNWADLQTEEFLHGLSKQSRNKQENIFEFIKTEVSYLKILTITQKVIHLQKELFWNQKIKNCVFILTKVYVNVMVNDCKVEQKLIHQMFPDLERLIDLHRNLLDLLMERYKLSENKHVESIGDILLDIVSFLRAKI